MKNPNQNKFNSLANYIKKAQINKSEYFGDEKVKEIALSNWEDLKPYHKHSDELWESIVKSVWVRFDLLRVADIANEFKRRTGGLKILKRKEWESDIRDYFKKCSELSKASKFGEKVKVPESLIEDFKKEFALMDDNCKKWYKERFQW